MNSEIVLCWFNAASIYRRWPQYSNIHRSLFLLYDFLSGCDLPAIARRLPDFHLNEEAARHQFTCAFLVMVHKAVERLPCPSENVSFSVHEQPAAISFLFKIIPLQSSCHIKAWMFYFRIKLGERRISPWGMKCPVKLKSPLLDGMIRTISSLFVLTDCHRFDY